MTLDTSLIVQALPIAILVLDASPDFVIQHASDEYLEATLAHIPVPADDGSVFAARLPSEGHELARDLRAQPHSALARLIAVTGYGSLEQDAAAHFDRYLVKPVDFGKLTRMLDELDVDAGKTRAAHG